MVRAGIQAQAAGWLLLAVLALSFAPSADAQIFMYKDEHGRTFFTDTPQHEGFARYKPKSEYALRTASRPPQNASRLTRAYDPAIQRASRQHGVSAALVKAIIAAESGFDPGAVSRKGAQGLMQLMPGTADAMRVDDPFNPEENIFGGTRYLSLMLSRFKNDKRLALAAYNAGPEKVEDHRGVPPFAETKSFIDKVLQYYSQYRSGAK
jgi:soluble lytic murein transglycosylase